MASRFFNSCQGAPNSRKEWPILCLHTLCSSGTRILSGRPQPMLGQVSECPFACSFAVILLQVRARKAIVHAVFNLLTAFCSRAAC
ncbi:hypothetical protein BU16DRAFT_160398 [Lophium mytilinum]|uniref:Uncharacterized protein n=1 Tax=Lophium mytilinum TaxID=390894 RepID=A0A6A6QC51_9PEZI|nr:hypothetical protein BU16DRAFT_160398 [Lophium mytilinum]